MNEEYALAAKLALKVLAVMATVTNIEKNGFNQHFKYEFASESDVLREVRTAMIEAKLAILPSLLECNQDGKRTRVKVEFALIDAETGFARSAVWEAEADDAQDKGINKAFTACCKYFLLKTFLIPTGDDPDGAAPPPVDTKAKKQTTPPATNGQPVVTGSHVVHNLTPAEAVEIKERIKHLGIKFSDFCREASEANQIGFTALLKRSAKDAPKAEASLSSGAQPASSSPQPHSPGTNGAKQTSTTQTSTETATDELTKTQASIDAQRPLEKLPEVLGS